MTTVIGAMCGSCSPDYLWLETAAVATCPVIRRCHRGPLSPLLSNLVLDELDRELERRGHRFVRYADDCNIYVQF